MEDERLPRDFVGGLARKKKGRGWARGDGRKMPGPRGQVKASTAERYGELGANLEQPTISK